MSRLVILQDHTVPCFRFRERHLRQLQTAFPRDEIVWCHESDGLDGFLSALRTTEAAFTWRWETEWNDLAPQLRYLATPAAGHDFFPEQMPPRILVHHGQFHGEFMSETLLGMMLGFQRGIFDAVKRQCAGELWPRLTMTEPASIRNTHAVMIGVGQIAQWVIRALKPFGIRITGFCRHPERAKLPTCCDDADRVLPIGKLHEVLPEADHLILILPNDTGTDNLIGAAELAKLPPHAVVYNIGRGNCIDERSLADALESRKIKGACLDVFAEEPLPVTSPLARNLPGLMRMPHVSAFEDKYMDRFVAEAIRWLAEARGRDS